MLKLNKPSGFDTWKDVLSVLVVPISAIALGIIMPILLDDNRRQKFESLIARELHEIEPRPNRPQNAGSWTQHVNKSFIHEKILNDASGNRDFILSLNPNLSYYVSQMWSLFREATNRQVGGDAEKHRRNKYSQKKLARKWVSYYERACRCIERIVPTHNGPPRCMTSLKDWKSLIKSYHKTVVFDVVKDKDIAPCG